MKASRHVIVGRFKGIIHYCSTTTDMKFIKWVDKTKFILFTDGTVLSISARRALPYERVKESHQYKNLVHNCFKLNVSSVIDLYKKLDGKRERVLNSK